MPKTKDAVKILHHEARNDPEAMMALQKARLNAEVAQLIYDARTAAELTQRQLAQKIGTTQSVIARLEDADYEGHSLNMLQRVAIALEQRLEIRMLPVA